MNVIHNFNSAEQDNIAQNTFLLMNSDILDHIQQIFVLLKVSLWRHITSTVLSFCLLVRPCLQKLNLKHLQQLACALFQSPQQFLKWSSYQLRQSLHKTLCRRSGLNPSSPVTGIFFHEPSSVSLRCRKMIVPQIFV